MADLATILTSASTQMCVTHKLRALTSLEDLTAVVMLDGEDRGHILYVPILMNVQKELIGNVFFFSVPLCTC